MQNGSLLNSLIAINSAANSSSTAAASKAGSRSAESNADFERLMAQSHTELMAKTRADEIAKTRTDQIAKTRADQDSARQSARAAQEASRAREANLQAQADAEPSRRDSSTSQSVRTEAQSAAEPRAERHNPQKSEAAKGRANTQADKPDADSQTQASAAPETTDKLPKQSADAGDELALEATATEDQADLDSCLADQSEAALLVDASLLLQGAVATQPDASAADEQSLLTKAPELKLPGLLAKTLVEPQGEANQGEDTSLDVQLAQLLPEDAAAVADADETGSMSDSTGLKTLWAGSKSAEAQLLKSTQENSANQAGAQQSVSADISQLLPEKLASFKALLNANQTNTPATAGAAQVVDTVAATSPVASAASALDVLSRPLDSMSPAARTFAVQTSVAQTVGQPGWSQAVGDRVLWLAAQNLSAAEIRLDPPDLGSMHVKVAVHDNQASVSFVSPHPVVREALDQQANRLREMFSEQGLNLVNVDVSERQQNPNSQEQGQGNGQAGTKAEDETVQVVASTPVASLRLVDHYA